MSPERSDKQKTVWPLTKVTFDRPGKVTITAPDGVKIFLEIPKKKDLPNSLVDSILPYFKNVFESYPDILSVDESFWLNLQDSAKYDSIKAAHLARKAGYSAFDLSDVALSRIQQLSGNREISRENITNKFLEDLEKATKALYNAYDRIQPTQQIELLKHTTK